jgi:hypothetical protein
MPAHFDETTTAALIDTLYEIVVRNIDGGEEEFDFTLPFDEWYESTGVGVFTALTHRLSDEYEVWSEEEEIYRDGEDCILCVSGECTEIYVAGRLLFSFELSDKEVAE